MQGDLKKMTRDNLEMFFWENRQSAAKLARILVAAGEKVRLCCPSNNGWHSYDSRIAVRWGERIRNPQKKFDVEKMYLDDNKKAISLWEASGRKS